MTDMLVSGRSNGLSLARPVAAGERPIGLLQRFASGEAARFVVAGGLASAINWLARFPLSLVLPFLPAVATAYVLGMGFGFVLYRTWVFPGSSVPLTRQISRFVLVNAGGLSAVVLGAKLVLGALAIAGLASGLGQALAHAAGVVLGAGANFAGHRLVTFARRAAPPGAVAV